MTIDWSRPLMTNAGKPARERGVHDEWGGLPTMLVDIPETDDCFYFFNDGTSYGDGKHIKLRNATPAEILANPDVWPEHQDWARENAVMMQGPATYAKANPQPRDWLTPETAIGCKLPCGATVVGAQDRKNGLVSVNFDREPISREGAPVSEDGWWFYSNGVQYSGILPNLIPPTPQSRGVLVTREALRKVYDDCISRGAGCAADTLSDALGLPPDPPKQAPWEAAYEAWHGGSGTHDTAKAWKAAIEWCAQQIWATPAQASASASLADARRRIMWDDA